MQNTLKFALVGCAAALAGQAAFSATTVPEVSGVTLSQPPNTRLATIEYTLANGPAVITLDIQTNAHDDVWASIGGENIQCFNPNSDVWKKVEGNGKHYIYWHPEQSWAGQKPTNVRAVVKAWALDNTPDYMVCDLAVGAVKNSQRYYPAESFIPGGLLKNSDYRLNKMVMRKIVAKNVTFTMGSINEAGRGNNENTVTATLTNNFYMGVFEVTQGQWALVIKRKFPSSPEIYDISTFKGHPTFPVNNVPMDYVRWYGAGYYPKAPTQWTFLHWIREVTGIDDFDLPCESQWEYACRAGNGEGTWGNGSAYQGAETDSNLPGRYGETSPVEVGSYSPNDWGLYDMHGNVSEWCNDWYSSDITGYGGRPNINMDDPTKDLSGKSRTASDDVKTCVLRGGYYKSASAGCRSAARDSAIGGYNYAKEGFRVICRAGLE